MINRTSNNFFLIGLVLLLGGALHPSFSQDKSPKPTSESAINYFSRGDYENAYREFEVLSQNFSKDPLYKYYSGVCLVMLKREPEKASVLIQDALNGSLEIKTIPDDALFYLGRSQQMEGKYGDAISSFSSFEKKAGKKAARDYKVSTYVEECKEGTGSIGEMTTAAVLATVSDPVSGINQEVEKESVRADTNKQVKPENNREDVPAEYDLLLSDAMFYQIKADSVNKLIIAKKKELSALPASQREEAKLEISRLESLASDFQRSADMKFNRAGTPVSQKQDTTKTLAPPVKETERKEIFSLFRIEPNLEQKAGLNIPVDPELPEGLLYRIQIGVFSKPPGPGFFKGIAPVAGFTVPGTSGVKYFAGLFRRFEDASKALLAVKKTGFRDSFITSVTDGKPISVDRAAMLEKEWGQKPLVTVGQAGKVSEANPATLSFKVELTRLSIPAGKGFTEVCKQLAGTRSFEILMAEDGLFVYLIGKFITFESASEFSDLLQRNGYRDSHVTAYLGIKEIPVEKARELLMK